MAKKQATKTKTTSKKEPTTDAPPTVETVVTAAIDPQVSAEPTQQTPEAPLEVTTDNNEPATTSDAVESTETPEEGILPKPDPVWRSEANRSKITVFFTRRGVPPYVIDDYLKKILDGLEQGMIVSQPKLGNDPVVTEYKYAEDTADAMLKVRSSIRFLWNRFLTP